MTTRLPEAVIFDCWGVMVLPREDHYLCLDAHLQELDRYIAREETRPVGLVAAGADDRRLYATGALTEAEYFAGLCERFVRQGGYLPVDPDSARAALWTWKMEPCLPMIELVITLRKMGVLTALLTNMGTGARRYWQEVTGGLFDVVVNSSSPKVAQAKPDPNIYHLTCQWLGVHPSACIFLDDTHCNVVTANNLGMEGIHCTDPPRQATMLVERFLGARELGIAL